MKIFISVINIIGGLLGLYYVFFEYPEMDILFYISLIIFLYQLISGIILLQVFEGYHLTLVVFFFQIISISKEEFFFTYVSPIYVGIKWRLEEYVLRFEYKISNKLGVIINDINPESHYIGINVLALFLFGYLLKKVLSDIPNE